MQESFCGFDADDTTFGTMLARRLGYMDVKAGSWTGNEAEGMRRDVWMVVKCPPKPMLPDTTRVHITHRLQRTAHDKLLLEREVATLDVPYGEIWSLQERWLVTADSAAPDSAVELCVSAHIHFKSRVMLATKIKTHALKRSRKCAVLAAELLQEAAHADTAAMGDGALTELDGGGGGTSVELLSLREAHAALLEEATFYKRQAQQLERENRKLLQQSKMTNKSKRQLVQQIADLEAEIQRERRERAAMEVALSQAYSQTLRDLLAKQDAPEAGAPAAASADKGKPSSRHGWFR